MSGYKGKGYQLGRESRRADFFFPREMTREAGTFFEPSPAAFGLRAWLADLITREGAENETQ